MRQPLRISVLAIVSAVATLLAQGGPQGRGHVGPGPRLGFGPMAGLGTAHGKVVTGAPYSADVSNQSTQTLADGNNISRTTEGHVSRDSQGRTYSQDTMTGGPFGSKGPVTITFITDPVAGYSYMLNSEKKTAMRRALRKPPEGVGYGNRMLRGERRRDHPNFVTSDLGTQSINGVQATGKSITHTVPAEAMGNSLPLVSTSETWYSPDLQIIVLAKRNDPRFGQSTFSITNIQRAEPSPSLFQVPSEYTVTDAKDHRGSRGRHGRGVPPTGTPEPSQL